MAVPERPKAGICLSALACETHIVDVLEPCLRIALPSGRLRCRFFFRNRVAFLEFGCCRRNCPWRRLFLPQGLSLPLWRGDPIAGLLGAFLAPHLISKRPRPPRFRWWACRCGRRWLLCCSRGGSLLAWGFHRRLLRFQWLVERF